MGFVDFLRMLMGWWSNPGGTPPASVTPPITEIAVDYDHVVNYDDDYDRVVNYGDDYDWRVELAVEIE